MPNSPPLTPAKCFQNFGWRNHYELAEMYLQHTNGTMVATGKTKELLMFHEEQILEHIRMKAVKAAVKVAEEAAEKAAVEDLEKLTEMYLEHENGTMVATRETLGLLMIMKPSILVHIQMKAKVQ